MTLDFPNARPDIKCLKSRNTEFFAIRIWITLDYNAGRGLLVNFARDSGPSAGWEPWSLARC